MPTAHMQDPANEFVGVIRVTEAVGWCAVQLMPVKETEGTVMLMPNAMLQVLVRVCVLVLLTTLATGKYAMF